MSDSVVVDKLPSCDVCRDNGRDVVAQYDAKTWLGPWANLCADHFVKLAAHGGELGTGKGQRLVLASDES